MAAIDLIDIARHLPAAWHSRILDRIGNAGIKVLRMDASPLDEEMHDHAEALLVLEGVLELSIGEQQVSLGAGEMRVVPANQPHAVHTGSHGTLLIIAAEA
jgi:mannose-6-phosphate isomerase-like protein (cupin superfamily)